MKPIKIMNKLNESNSKRLNEGTDWQGLKAGLSHCTSAMDIEELMQETMSDNDWSRYCDFYYEIDDGDRSSLQWAKKGLRNLANENIKAQKPVGSIKSKVEKIANKVANAHNKSVTVSDDGDNYSIKFDGVGSSIQVYPETEEWGACIVVDDFSEVEGNNAEVINSLEDFLNGIFDEE